MATFLISSNTYKQLNDEISKIINNQYYDVFDLTVDDLKVVLETVNYSSLFSERRIIVIKNVNVFTSSKSKAEDALIIEEYLKNENPDLTLIFTTMGNIDSRKKIVKTIKASNNLVVCPLLTSKDIVSLILSDFRNDGYKIDSETAYYVVNAVLGNYDLVLSECEKIKLYYQDNLNIKLDDVKEIVASSLENNNFKLVDAITNGELKRALKICSDLRIQKVEPIMLINLIAREFRLIYLCSLLYKKRNSSFEISKKLGLQTWQVDKYLGKINKYSELRLKNIIKELAETDYKIKKGAINKFTALELFILKNG